MGAIYLPTLLSTFLTKVKQAMNKYVDEVTDIALAPTQRPLILVIL